MKIFIYGKIPLTNLELSATRKYFFLIKNSIIMVCSLIYKDNLGKLFFRHSKQSRKLYIISKAKVNYVLINTFDSG